MSREDRSGLVIDLIIPDVTLSVGELASVIKALGMTPWPRGQIGRNSLCIKGS